jgi:hypothetical protein
MLGTACHVAPIFGPPMFLLLLKIQNFPKKLKISKKPKKAKKKSKFAKNAKKFQKKKLIKKFQKIPKTASAAFATLPPRSVS